jgi:dTDP-glucose 4,6-dehydratase
VSARRASAQTLLVTGGAGFIGSCFVRAALERDPACRVVTLDLLTYAGSPENLNDLPDPGRHVFVHGDVCDGRLVRDLLRRHDVATVVHFAAESHVDRSIHGPADFVRTNVDGTLALLEAARTVWLDEGAGPEGRRFHHVSTDEVYGSLGPGDPPFGEASPYDPSSPYAASKAASDHLVHAWSRTYGLPVTLSNCSNNYGPRQFPEKLVPLVILNAMEGLPLPIYGDGAQVRDWLHVEDHCAALWEVVHRGRDGATYLVSAGDERTNLAVVRLLCAILDELLPRSRNVPHADLIRFVADRPGHDRRYALDSSRVRTELGWQPERSLESGLRAVVEWYLENGDWVRAIRARPEYRDWLSRNYGRRAPPAPAEAGGTAAVGTAAPEGSGVRAPDGAAPGAGDAAAAPQHSPGDSTVPTRLGG